MKNLVLLGSTGSIGTQTLEIIKDNEGIKVLALAAGKNASLMEEQIREFKPEYAVMYDEAAYSDLRERVKDLPVKVLQGMEGLLTVSALPKADIVETALVGMIGIQPTIAAIKAKKTIALANKETLVTAGHIIMPLAKENGVNIYPVDSEHSAIFQSLNGKNGNKISKILLTASGGPFRGLSYEELKTKTIEDALKHPNWSMGKKVTIDSASLVNKGLEVIEAKWLFDVDVKKIQVLIQPQSILHSAVEFEDGAVIGQMGVPDMKLPIQYALFYPERRPMRDNRIDFFKLGKIDFYEPDIKTFKGLGYAYEAARQGGAMPTVFNAANELAVKDFLERKISFTGIYDYIEAAMDSVKNIENPTVFEILDTEKAAYEAIKKVFY